MYVYWRISLVIPSANHKVDKGGDIRTDSVTKVGNYMSCCMQLKMIWSSNFTSPTVNI